MIVRPTTPHKLNQTPKLDPHSHDPQATATYGWHGHTATLVDSHPWRRPTLPRLWLRLRMNLVNHEKGYRWSGRYAHTLTVIQRNAELDMASINEEVIFRQYGIRHRYNDTSSQGRWETRLQRKRTDNPSINNV